MDPGLLGAYTVGPANINVIASAGTTVASSTFYDEWRAATSYTHYFGAEASLVDIAFAPFPDLENWTSLYFDFSFASPENLTANLLLDYSGQSLQNDFNGLHGNGPEATFERQLVSGYVSGEILTASVPIAATGWLVAVAILGLGIIRGRKT